jgi:hypothetical protein
MRAWSAEVFKTRRTLTLWLVVLAPLALMFLEFMTHMQMGGRAMRPNTNAWESLSQYILLLWTLLMLPLFVTLETGLLNALEHSNTTWKQLYALPLPRWTVYAAKQLMGMGLIALSMIVLLGMVLGVGWLLDLFKPELGFRAPIDWEKILPVFVLPYLASWLLTSLHLWVSARWPSFVFAMGVGIVATVAGVMLFSSDWARYYPWILPGYVMLGWAEGEPIGLQLTLGIAGGIGIALAGGWDVTRRDVL